MIVRLVKMTFKEDTTDLFLKIFERSRLKILEMNGCSQLKLYRSESNPNIFTTYSHWESEVDLNAYRDSGLFKKTWSETKELFGAKPEATSLTEVKF